MTMPTMGNMPNPKIEQAITAMYRRIPKADLPRMERMAKARGYGSFEAFLRHEATQRVGGQAVDAISQVQPTSYAPGGPLAGLPSAMGAPGSLPGAAPAGGLPMLPAAGESSAVQMSASQRLAQAAAGNPLPTRATQMLPQMAPSTATSLAAETMAAVNPVKGYTAGGPLSLLGKTPGWDNGLAGALEGIGPPAGMAASPMVPQAAQAAQAAMGSPFTPKAASGLSYPVVTDVAAPTAGALAPEVAPVVAGALGGGAASKLPGFLGGEAGLLGGMSKARFGAQAFGGAIAGQTAAKFTDKYTNLGGKNSIWDQFTTGAVGGGVAGGIAGAGTGPGALLSAGAGAVVGGLGNVAGNQLGLWGAKANPAAKANVMDLAVAKLMNAADTAGLTNTQELAQALRSQSSLYAGKGGKAALNADVDKLITSIPQLQQQQTAEKQRLAYDSKFRAETIANMQPRIDAMTRQYGMLADLYKQRGDAQFASALRANAQQQAAALISSVSMIPQQYALDRARNFAAQLDQARMSQQIGQIVNPKTGGGLEALATG